MTDAKSTLDHRLVRTSISEDALPQVASVAIDDVKQSQKTPLLVFRTSSPEFPPTHHAHIYLLTWCPRDHVTIKEALSDIDQGVMKPLGIKTCQIQAKEEPSGDALDIREVWKQDIRAQTCSNCCCPQGILPSEKCGN